MAPRSGELRALTISPRNLHQVSHYRSKEDYMAQKAPAGTLDLHGTTLKVRESTRGIFAAPCAIDRLALRTWGLSFLDVRHSWVISRPRLPQVDRQPGAYLMHLVTPSRTLVIRPHSRHLLLQPRSS